MKLQRACMFVLLSCGHGIDTSNPEDFVLQPVDASAPDATHEAAPDAAVDTTYPAYVGCVTELDLASEYPRLTERVCTDSNGITYVRGMHDSLLNIACRWRPASDGTTRCLPENEQSAPEYADDFCKVPVGLVVPGGRYIGVAGVVYLAGARHQGGTYCLDVDGCTVCNALGYLGLETHHLGDIVQPYVFVLR